MEFNDGRVAEHTDSYTGRGSILYLVQTNNTIWRCLSSADCGGYLNVTEKGTYVTSPGYSSGGQYVDNTQCNWMVQVRSSIGIDFVVSEDIIYIY